VREEREERPPVLIEGGCQVPVSSSTFGEVENLPEPSEGTTYLVSALVLNALREKGVKRGDVFAPDTSRRAVRDNEGRIVAVTGLLSL
jgi:hypothetical protein